MSPRSVSDPLVRESPVLTVSDTIAHAIGVLLATDLPALPVVDERDRLKGVFGEREFFAALFPGYLSQMSSAGFVPRVLESVLEKRATCRNELVGKYMNTEHVDLGPDASDTAVAETFLHHRVLIVPIADHGRILGVITRADFFRAAAERFLAAPQ
jgi:CBS domain-containing protein